MLILASCEGSLTANVRQKNKVDLSTQYSGLVLVRDPRTPALNEEALALFCSQKRATLPPDYIEFLRSTNGGRIHYALNVALVSYRRLGRTVSEPIDGFLPFEMHRTLVAQPSIWRAGCIWRPAYLYEIAQLTNGDWVFIGVTKGVSGVYVFSRTTYRVQKSIQEDDFCREAVDYKVADGFTDFLRGLVIKSKK